MGYEEFEELVRRGLSATEGPEDLARFLWSLFKAVDLTGKTLLVQIDVGEGRRLDNLYLAAEHIRAMGARSVLFLPRNAEVGVLELFGKSVTMKLEAATPNEVVERYVEWVRCAGAKQVYVLRSGERIEVRDGDTKGEGS